MQIKLNSHEWFALGLGLKKRLRATRKKSIKKLTIILDGVQKGWGGGGGIVQILYRPARMGLFYFLEKNVFLSFLKGRVGHLMRII